MTNNLMHLENSTPDKILAAANSGFNIYYKTSDGVQPVTYEKHLEFSKSLKEILQNVSDDNTKEQNVNAVVNAIETIEKHMLRVDWSVRMAETLHVMGLEDEQKPIFF